MTKTIGSAFQDHYAQLLVVARARLAKEQAPISTMTLAHELYLSLQGRPALQFGSMEEFLGYASHAMRHLLVSMARERIAQKRSADLLPLTIGEEVADHGSGTPENILALNQALERLEQADPRLLQVAEMRAVMGMEVPAIAQALGLSESTVKRDWRVAEVFLRDLLSNSS